MTTDEGREGDGETSKILRLSPGQEGEYYFILFPGMKDARDDEAHVSLQGSYRIVVLVKIHLTRQ